MACDTHRPFKDGETLMSVRNLSFYYGGRRSGGRGGKADAKPDAKPDAELGAKHDVGPDAVHSGKHDGRSGVLHNAGHHSRPALHGINLEFKAGRLCGLLGPNGSGKTTLFKCCLGFNKPDQGSVELGGRPLREFSQRHLASHLAYVPQEHQATFPFLVREMVEMGRTPHRSGFSGLTEKDRHVVAHALELVGLSELAEENYSRLSGGQRQLVLVARALAQEAFMLFLDEPTSSLDFSNQLVVWETVRDIARQGMGAVICCHDPNHILWFCDEVAVLKHGRLLASGPVKSTITSALLEELYERPVTIADAWGKTFICP
ncbi:ABC transporter ATP-binding protein [Desulfovibrio sp. OttesenSCG-928-C06]|nr:ABC transporter ATP-binding protein [Desulfovibrio sp. OttesenSCG-928-C06]